MFSHIFDYRQLIKQVMIFIAKYVIAITPYDLLYIHIYLFISVYNWNTLN